MGDRAAAGVPDQHHLAAGRVARVDHLHDRVDMVTQRDLGAVGVFRLHAGQRERIRAVPRLLQGGNDLVPRRAVKPETGNQDDVHGPRLGLVTDIIRLPARRLTGEHPDLGAGQRGPLWPSWPTWTAIIRTKLRQHA